MIDQEHITRQVNSIAQNIAEEIKSAGLSVRGAANLTGISLSTLRRRLTCESPFLINEIDAIADLLGTTVTKLVTTEATSRV